MNTNYFVHVKMNTKSAYFPKTRKRRDRKTVYLSHFFVYCQWDILSVILTDFILCRDPRWRVNSSKYLKVKVYYKAIKRLKMPFLTVYGQLYNIANWHNDFITPIGYIDEFSFSVKNSLFLLPMGYIIMIVNFICCSCAFGLPGETGRPPGGAALPYRYIEKLILALPCACDLYTGALIGII